MTGHESAWGDAPTPCRFGYEEYDGARYCHEHAGFLEAGVQSRMCDRARGEGQP